MTRATLLALLEAAERETDLTERVLRIVIQGGGDRDLQEFWAVKLMCTAVAEGKLAAAVAAFREPQSGARAARRVA